MIRRTGNRGGARMRVVAHSELAVIDGNRDGNVRRQHQTGATAGSQSLLLSRADLAIRYT